LRRGGIFEPGFVRDVLRARPNPRLRWHYFMLWQMIGLEMWREIFLEGDRFGAPSRSDATVAGSPPA
jgi:hypothetical protein